MNKKYPEFTGLLSFLFHFPLLHETKLITKAQTADYKQHAEECV